MIERIFERLKSFVVVIAAVAVFTSLAGKVDVTINSVQRRDPPNNKVDIVYTLTNLNPQHAYTLTFRLARGAVTNDIQNAVRIAAEGAALAGSYTLEISQTTAPDFTNIFSTTNLSVTALLFDQGARAAMLDSSDGLSFQPGDYALLNLADGTVEKRLAVSEIAANDFTNEVYKTTKMVFRRIPSGSFKMMSADTVNGAGTTGIGAVTFENDYYIAIFETTAAQYEMATTGAITITDDARFKPKNNMSLKSFAYTATTGILAPINAKCAANGCRVAIPNEAQWERAARAGSTMRQPFASADAPNYVWSSENTSVLQPVGLKLPNAWGLYDTLGNVEEICSDAWTSSTPSRNLQPGGAYDSTAAAVVRRGGAYLGTNETALLSSDITLTRRTKHAADSDTAPYNGFRLVLTFDVEDLDGRDEGVDGFVPGDYVVVDLQTGETEVVPNVTTSNYFASDEFKTTKMVFRKIPAGSFMMQSLDTARGTYATGFKVTMKDDYYMSVYNLTEGQEYMLRTKAKWSSRRAKTNINWNDAIGVVGSLNALLDQSAYIASLPNEAEWERAARAGMTTPECWGLFDMVGDIWQLCLDLRSDMSPSTQPGGDPLTPNTYVVRRGGVNTSLSRSFAEKDEKDEGETADVRRQTGCRMVLHARANGPKKVELAKRDKSVFVEGDYIVVDLTNAVPSCVRYNGVKDINAFAADEYKTSKMVFRRVPANTFTFRGKETENGQFSTATLVSLDEYYVAIYELTQKQCKNLGLAVAGCVTSNDKHPVNNQTWDYYAGGTKSVLTEMQKKVGGAFKVALPSLRQWECAARAGSTTKYYYEDGGLSDYAHYGKGVTTKVGSLKPNAWGLYDVLGNVAELTTDEKASSSILKKIVCGGSWVTTDANNCAVTSSSLCGYEEKQNGTGCRLVMTVDTSQVVKAESKPVTLDAVCESIRYSIKDDEGRSVAVSIPKGWMKDRGMDPENSTEIHGNGANGLPVWKSYVLGLEPTNAHSKTVVAGLQTANPDTMTLTFKDFAPITNAGVSLWYQLGTGGATNEFTWGEESNRCVFENVPLPTADEGVKYYRMKVRLLAPAAQ